MDENGIPQGRGVCGASSTINQRMSDLLSDLLVGTASSEKESFESSSTEDMIAAVDDFNDKVRVGKIKEGSLMVGSLDVQALYPTVEGAFGDFGELGRGSCPACSLGGAQCQGAVSNCWSPGQRDSDCPNNGLCW